MPGYALAYAGTFLVVSAAKLGAGVWRRADRVEPIESLDRDPGVTPSSRIDPALLGPGAAIGAFAALCVGIVFLCERAPERSRLLLRDTEWASSFFAFPYFFVLLLLTLALVDLLAGAGIGRALGPVPDFIAANVHLVTALFSGLIALLALPALERYVRQRCA